jgi:DNA-binding NarL/FixJ family response regulator
MFETFAMGASAFLIVEPDQDTAQVLAQLCLEFRATQVTRGLAEARRAIGMRSRWAGVIQELELADGSGLELLELVRGKYPLLPVLVLTRLAEPSAINRVHVLRAEYHCKPTHRRALRGFVQHAVALDRVRDGRVASIIDNYVQRFGLSPRETDLLAAAVAGTPRKTLADELGTTENTLKTQVRQLLRKCDQKSLEDLGRVVLREAITSNRPPSAQEPTPPSNRDVGPPTIRPSSGSWETAPPASSGVIPLAGVPDDAEIGER